MQSHNYITNLVHFLKYNLNLHILHAIRDVFGFCGLEWNEFLSATWWGGLRMEATQEGGSAWANDLYGFKAVLPMNSAPRRPDAFCHAKFVKSINS